MKTRSAAWMVLAALTVSACTRQETIREVDWAKAALARNPNFEIVATDESTGVFTVRDTASGEIGTLKLGELIAAPPPPKEAVQPTPAAEPAQPGPAPQADTSDTTLAANQTTEVVQAVPPGGPSLAEGPGYRIARATGDTPDSSAETLEGPGYRIEKSGIEESGTERQAVASADSGEKRTDPIICQGNRLMRIDGEVLSFSGDAVIAERGCDLYISNARIRAGGVGIIARQQARVHIVNSSIGGARGSYEVSDGAELYVARTTITGVGRRFDTASMTDLGGNSYESH